MKKVLMVLFVMVLVLFSNTIVDAMVDFQEECINKQKCVSKEFDGVCKCDYYGSKSDIPATANYDCSSANEFQVATNEGDNYNVNNGIFNYLQSIEYEEQSICEWYCALISVGEYGPAEDTSENTCKIVDMNPEEHVSASGCQNTYSEEKCRNTDNGNWINGCCNLSYVCWIIDKEDGSQMAKWEDLDPCENNSMNYQHCEIDKSITNKEKCEKKSFWEFLNNDDPDESENPSGGEGMDIDPLKMDESDMTCGDILGKTGRKIVKGAITAFQIIAAIIAIVKASTMLIPAVAAKDAEQIKKMTPQLVMLAIVLVLILIFRPVVILLGEMLNFDVTCVL